MKDDGLYECHVGIIDKTSRHKVILDSGSIILTVIGVYSVMSCTEYHHLQTVKWFYQAEYSSYCGLRTYKTSQGGDKEVRLAKNVPKLMGFFFRNYFRNPKYE